MKRSLRSRRITGRAAEKNTLINKWNGPPSSEAHPRRDPHWRATDSFFCFLFLLPVQSLDVEVNLTFSTSSAGSEEQDRSEDGIETCLLQVAYL